MKKFLLILLLIFITKVALAFSIIPAKIETTQKAGIKKEYSFIIKNTKEEPILIRLSIRDFDITIDGKILITERETLPDWIRMHIKIKEVKISPDASKKIPFIIQLSTDTTGEKHCMFYFQEIPKKKEGVTIVMRRACAIYCRVKGTEKIKGKIENFKISLHNVQLLFSNLGNITLRPEIKLKIKDEQGEIIREIILTQNFPVLPFHKYIIEKKFENKLGIGRYVAILEIRYKEIFQAEEFPFGIFKVE